MIRYSLIDNDTVKRYNQFVPRLSVQTEALQNREKALVVFVMEFREITAEDKENYDSLHEMSPEHGCEYSFANLYMWGEQYMAKVGNDAVIFSHFNGRDTYLFPIGGGDKKESLDAIISDAAGKGIQCRITGVTNDDREIIEKLYPGRFDFKADRDFFDYVYSVDDLAELKGKKYHGKKGHYRKFCDAHEGYSAELITEDNVQAVRDMLDDWYAERETSDAYYTFDMERNALKCAFAESDKLGVVGLVIVHEGRVLAFSMGSRLSHDTFDVHFEKAASGVDGAYAAINCEFAKFIRENYPDVSFLNREDDMGIEGLRRAKESYKPHHMVEKFTAKLTGDVI